MKDSTKKRKKAIMGMQEAYGRQELNDRLYQILTQGKQGFDVFMKELGRMMAETIMYIEREEISGPDYQPFWGIRDTSQFIVFPFNAWPNNLLKL